MSVASLPLAFLVMLLIALLFTALGTAVASMLDDFQGFQFIMNFLVMPMFFLSGALFPLRGLPLALDITAKLDPLSYGVDSLRGALTGAVHYGMTLDITILSVLTAIVLVLGGYLFSKIQL